MGDRRILAFKTMICTRSHISGFMYKLLSFLSNKEISAEITPNRVHIQAHNDNILHELTINIMTFFSQRHTFYRC